MSFQFHDGLPSSEAEARGVTPIVALQQWLGVWQVWLFWSGQAIEAGTARLENRPCAPPFGESPLHSLLTQTIP
jgi:hypothetical protein